MMDVIWARFLHDMASRSVEGMQVASLQPQDLPLDWSQGTYGDQNGWLSNRCGTVADTMVSG